MDKNHSTTDLLHRGSYDEMAPVCLTLTVLLAPLPAAAQLAPTGGHYAARASDTGFAGAVNSSGGYGASVPLTCPRRAAAYRCPCRSSMAGTASVRLAWDGTCRCRTSFATRRLRAAGQQISLTPAPKRANRFC